MEHPMLTEEKFRERFDSMVPLIRGEWPGVEETALRGCAGDLARTVDLIAGRTEHTKTKIRRDLEELWTLSRVDGGSTASLEALLGSLEGRLKKAVGQVRSDALPKAEDTVRTNLWTSLAIAAAVGFVLGVFMSGSRR